LVNDNIFLRRNWITVSTQKLLIAALLGMCLLVASASASSINYNTTGSTPYLSEFTSTGTLVLNDTSGTGGATASLTFTPNSTVGAGVGNINLGKFTLVCTGCSTNGGADYATFGSFTFDLYVDDTSDGAIGEFIGTASSGTVYSNSSGITISWSPTTIGPGATGALSGNFGTTTFTVFTPTPIVDPSSSGGVTTVQGALGSTAVPEPTTMALFGGGLIGLAAILRKRRA
jgi:hypothetical protein